MKARIMSLGLNGLSVALGACALVMLIATSPQRIGPFGVTVWFIFLWVALSGGIAVLVRMIWPARGAAEGNQERRNASKRQGALIAGWIVVNLALSSLGQLTIRDILLSLILLVLVEIYFNLR
jgi:cobalamin synthase